MNPEAAPTPEKNEAEKPFEVNVGDILFVSRNLKDEKGLPKLDDEGKRMTALEDGWEVVSLSATNPNNGREGIMLRNTDNEDELKFYSASQLQGFQEQKEADIMSRASSVASEMLGEIDQHSAEIGEEEPRVTEEQAEKIGEEVLDVADVSEPETQPEASATLAEVMSGEKQGPIKFDMEAAAERLRLEDEQRLIPREDINKIQPVLSEILRQYDIAMTADNPQEAEGFRYNLESGLVQQSRQIMESVKRGETNPLAGAMLEGAFAGSARTPEGLEAIMNNVRQGDYGDQEMSQVEAVVNELQARMIQEGKEGEHFSSFGFNVEQQMNQVLNANDQVPNKAYATLIGILVGSSGRIGPDAQHHAYMRMQGGIDHLASFKK